MSARSVLQFRVNSQPLDCIQEFGQAEARFSELVGGDRPTDVDAFRRQLNGYREARRPRPRPKKRGALDWLQKPKKRSFPARFVWISEAKAWICD